MAVPVTDWVHLERDLAPLEKVELMGWPVFMLGRRNMWVEIADPDAVNLYDDGRGYRLEWVDTAWCDPQKGDRPARLLVSREDYERAVPTLSPRVVGQLVDAIDREFSLRLQAREIRRVEAWRAIEEL